MQWMILGIALIGTGLNARGRWQGFAFWLVSNTWWAVHNMIIGEYAQAVLYITYWVLAAYGLVYWIRKGKAT